MLYNCLPLLCFGLRSEVHTCQRCSEPHWYVYLGWVVYCHGAAAPQVLTLIARAHHDNNDHTAARCTLTRGLHMFPTDLKLRFNLAFVLQVRAWGWGERAQRV